MSPARREGAAVEVRTHALYARFMRSRHGKVDRLLMIVLGQWAFAIVVAVVAVPASRWSPSGWPLGVPVGEAVLVAALLNAVPLLLLLRNVRAVRSSAHRAAQLEHGSERIEAEVKARTAELLASREQYRDLLETSNTVPWEWGVASRRLEYLGPQAVRMFGYPIADWMRPRSEFLHVHPSDLARVAQRMNQVVLDGEACELEYRIDAADGRVVDVRSTVAVVRTAEGHVALRGLLFDITDRKRLELELAQAQKLESVGRLASGVAHEINTPVQFISDSVHFVRGATDDLEALIARYQALRAAVEAGASTVEEARAVAVAEEEVDLAYLLENIPKALDRSLEGIDRVTAIVRSMKEFAHPDGAEMTRADLNKAIRSTITIARGEYKYVADLVFDEGEIPPVTCYLGELNQVVLNIIVNAAHAIDDVVQAGGPRGTITVRTRREGEFVMLSITDTGGGIPAAIHDKIFDQFFTTKPVGKGTGQGLAMARAVIQKHRGSLQFETVDGVGTTFFIRLPIAGVAIDRAVA